MQIQRRAIFILSGILLTVAQAYSVRRRVPRLTAARGNTRGRARGRSRVIRLLVVGDSAAAGVGVERTEDALAAQIAKQLCVRTGQTIEWRTIGYVGATIEHVYEQLQRECIGDYDFVVIAGGVNDVVRLRSFRRWGRELDRLVAFLDARTSSRHVFISPLPPLWKLRALPIPLRWVLGASALGLNATTRAFARKRPRVAHVPIPLDDQRTMLACDRIHPSAYGYLIWASYVAAELADKLHAQVERSANNLMPAR